MGIFLSQVISRLSFNIAGIQTLSFICYLHAWTKLLIHVCRPNFSLNFSPNCILLLELIIKSQFSYLVFQIIGGIRAQTLTIINFAEFPLLYTSGIIFQNSKQFLVTFQINCTLALIYTAITYLEKFVNLNSIPKIFFYMQKYKMIPLQN